MICFWNGECNINFHGFYHYSYNFQRNFPSNLSYLPSWKSSRQVTSPGSWVLVPKVLCCHRVVLTQSSLHLAPTSLDMDDSENLESYGWNKEQQKKKSQIRITLRLVKINRVPCCCWGPWATLDWWNISTSIWRASERKTKGGAHTTSTSWVSSSANSLQKNTSFEGCVRLR